MDVVLQALVDELGAGRQVAQEPGVAQDLRHGDALLRAGQQHLRQQVLARHGRLRRLASGERSEEETGAGSRLAALFHLQFRSELCQQSGAGPPDLQTLILH